ncbi:hypothetical protein IPM65_04010 [Candidatus Roizmanbacteria bacterium]|nr:MAG: hypothetical protein IPM65_04010 [Candidatus Roizmanbacteria bacterium]
MENPFAKFLDSFRNLPDKKKYIEVITATLSIPVLLSVIYMNYINIQEKRNGPDTSDPVAEQPKDTTPTIITIIRDNDNEPTTAPENEDGTPTPTPESKGECIKDIGPIDILSPQENSTVSGNPLDIDIRYDQGDYCSVVWSYRINNGQWSDYSDNDIVIYNMSSGKKTLELRVRSLVSNQNKTLTRVFTYQNTDEQIPTPTNTVTPAISQ